MGVVGVVVLGEGELFSLELFMVEREDILLGRRDQSLTLSFGVPRERWGWRSRGPQGQELGGGSSSWAKKNVGMTT